MFALLYLTAAGVIYNLIAVGVVHLHDGLALALRILLGGGAFAILIVGLFAVINGLHRVTQA